MAVDKPSKYSPFYLPFLAKLLESLVKIQLRSFTESQTTYYVYISLPGHRTVTAAISVIDNIVSYLDKEQFCASLSSLISQKHLILLITKTYSLNYSPKVWMKPCLIGSTHASQRELRLSWLMILSQVIFPSEMGCHRGLSLVLCCLHYT